MLRKLIRKIRPNPLDRILKKAKKSNKKRFLLAWNRALGDIALGLYAVVYRIREFVPAAEITFLVRSDLKEGFELLEGIKYIEVPFWRRYMPFDIYHTLDLLDMEESDFDVIIDKVDPNYWVKWQIAKLTPRLKWKKEFDPLADKFNLPEDKILIGVQLCIETKHSSWRIYPFNYFKELFLYSDKDVKFVLFGQESHSKIDLEDVIDLRGKTSLLEVLSILKNKCLYFISLDSGLLSLFYYLNADFPFKLVSLWGSKNVGVIKQRVRPPNKKLMYDPLLFENGLEHLKPKELGEHIYPKDISDILINNNQTDLIEKFEISSIENKKLLMQEIFTLDLNALKRQKTFFEKKSKDVFKPLKVAKRAKEKDYKKGQKIIFQKKAACIILAAGQGSRLGFESPKGLFKINNKTLFEYFVQKIKDKQKKLKVTLFCSIMTSHLNHEKIISFFENNNFFGLKKWQIDFFTQSKAPFLDKEGNWVLENSKIVQSPDGNGSVFKSFYFSDIFFKYQKKGIKYLSIVPIDNPLCDPFDENLIGFHKNNRDEVTIKCIKRERKDEKNGALALDNDKIKIVEYISLDPNKNYLFSNTGIYVINLDFFKKIKNIDFNYNYVLKKVSNNKDFWAYKSESFIFDGFTYADKVRALLDQKEKFYVPLKDMQSLKVLEKLLK